MGTIPRTMCLWAIGGIPILVLGQAADVVSLDDYSSYSQQYQDGVAWADASATQPQPYYDQQAGHSLRAEELDQILSPIALYPDSLLSQVLMAATYPLDVVQADRWVKANANFSSDEAARALEVEPWDPSVKSLVNFPDVLAMLSEHLDWTQQLGDAFLGQPQDVADSIQRLRASAWNSGNLASTEQQIVYVQQQDPTPIIVIEPAVPDVIYVPVYDPVVYGYWPNAGYPPYRCYPRGYVGTPVLSFSIGRHCGFAWGYAWGRWDWGHRGIRIDINVNLGRNSFINPSRYASCQYPDSIWRHDSVPRWSASYRSEFAHDRDGSPGYQTRSSRDSYRGQSANTLLERLGSADLGRSNGLIRENGDRVAGESRDRNPVPEGRREPARDVVSRTPRSPGNVDVGDRQAGISGNQIPAPDRGRVPANSREHAPPLDKDRTPGNFQNRIPGRPDDNVAYIPAKPVGRGDGDPRSSNFSRTPLSSQLPRTSEPVSHEPRPSGTAPRELSRPDVRDRNSLVGGNRDVARSAPAIRQPTRPDFTDRAPVRNELERREPPRFAPPVQEPSRIRSGQPEVTRSEPRSSSVRLPSASSNVDRSPANIFEGLIRGRPETSKVGDRGMPSRSSSRAGSNFDGIKTGSSKSGIGKVVTSPSGSSKVGGSHGSASKIGSTKVGSSKTGSSRSGSGRTGSSSSQERHKPTRR